MSRSSGVAAADGNTLDKVLITRTNMNSQAREEDMMHSDGEI